MAEIPKNTVSVLLIVLLVCCYFFIEPTTASSMNNIKSELRDGNMASGGGGNTLNTGTATNNLLGKRNMRSIYGLGPKMLQISRSKIPIELDLLVENDDGDRSKRFDDYGHMRFGKRGDEEQFDDYGHMRFGRSA